MTQRHNESMGKFAGIFTLSASDRGAGSSFKALSVAYTSIGTFEPSVSASVKIAS